MHIVILAWGLFFAPHPRVQFNPFVNFKPDPKPFYGPSKAHWKATECAATDQACLNEHDARVLALTIMTGNIQTCWEAVGPAWCAESARRVFGDPRSARTLLVDPWIDAFTVPKFEKRKTP